ncbi:S24 family peptidase [Sandarakinorhabdus sp.]|uniref:S24 family peptidase n=1 Tax=Sandarakinorhabdus sp. TaxID=1916663 RepID=UPI00286E42D0|nr:S24 family peptidase [Sandarakinorhabdus sp.]
MDTVAIRQRLDALISARGEDYASLSRRLGRNPTYVQQFVKRGVPRCLSERDRRTLAQHFGIAERLLGGPDEASRALLPRPGLSSQADDYVLVAMMSRAGGIAETAQGAAPGPAILPDPALAPVAFRTGFIGAIASGRPEAMAAMILEGDSMLPALADGDQILVDTDDRERLREGIYVLRLGESLLVKRLSVHPATRRLSIRSDNDAFPSWDDCDPAAIDVIGRVVWVGRRLN